MHCCHILDMSTEVRCRCTLMNEYRSLASSYAVRVAVVVIGPAAAATALLMKEYRIGSREVRLILGNSEEFSSSRYRFPMI